MLDAAITQQLKTVFTRLEAPVQLAWDEAEHDKQAELVEMLRGVAATSENIEARASGARAEVPRFSILHRGEPTGVSFTGIPGGHEFTSLILGILNADRKGRLPDEGMIERIQRLQGPVRVRTFVSLSCENCPDVVQALNLMAILHEDFTHEMVDGSYLPGEVERLGIQGVPAVMAGTTLVSSGKSSLADLLGRLEAHFGVAAAEVGPRALGHVDVAVIGSGPAGASAAIYTARKGLSTAIITDRMGGQLLDTKGIENLVSVPYIEGPPLAAKLRAHVDAYDIKLLEHRRVERVEPGSPATLTLNSGETLTAGSVIVATGAQWRELGVPGEKEYLGRGVAFCPHCDGPFYKGRDIAVVGGGNSGVEAAIDLAGIVKSVTVLEFMPELKADQVLVDKLESLPNATVLKNVRTDRIVGDDAKVTGLVYQDRESGAEQELPLAGVFVQIGLVPNSGFIREVVATNRWGEIEVDGKCHTNVPGIYAAGDVTTVPYKQIVVALGEGAKAGLAAFEDQMLS